MSKNFSYSFLPACLLAAASVCLLTAADEDRPKPAAGALVAQFVGRLVVGIDGSSEVIGYFPVIEGLGTSLFGSNSERTERRALFSVRSVKINLSRIPNGPVNHFLLAPAASEFIDYHVYFNASPNRDFASPESFANGQHIGILRARNGMVSVMPSGSSYSAELGLADSSDFVFEGRTRNLKELGAAVNTHILGGALSLTEAATSGLSIPIFGHASAIGK